MARTGTAALWLILLPFTVWGAHFLAVYGVTAIYCAKSADPGAAILAVRWITVALTLLALAAQGFVLRAGFARYRAEASPAARAEARFLRPLLVMMGALSALAIVYVAAVVFFFGDCR